MRAASLHMQLSSLTSEQSEGDGVTGSHAKCKNWYLTGERQEFFICFTLSAECGYGYLEIHLFPTRMHTHKHTFHFQLKSNTHGHHCITIQTRRKVYAKNSSLFVCLGFILDKQLFRRTISMIWYLLVSMMSLFPNNLQFHADIFSRCPRSNRNTERRKTLFNVQS